ncbi:MAG: hypothetical protein IJ598_06235 [Ruminococcus sp.]|nr:hypothetical protein [Ruminococcus sp.]
MKKTLISLLLSLSVLLGMGAVGVVSVPAAETASSEAGSYALKSPKIEYTDVYDDELWLQWEYIPEAAQYRLFRKEPRGSWMAVTTTDSTNCCDETAVSGKTYVYTVRCMNAAGTAYTSPLDEEGFTCTFIAKVRIKDIQTTNEGVKLSWDKVGGAAKYDILVHDESDDFHSVGTTTATSFIHKDVQSGKKYTYLVRCVDANGVIHNDNSISPGEIIGITYYAAPQILGIVSTTEGVKLSWNDTGAFNYRVFYKGRNGWTRLGTTNKTTFTDTDVRDGGTYTYTVRCVDGYDEYCSDYDHSGKTFTYRTPMLSTPQVTTLRSVNEGVKLTWNPVSGAYGYRVFYKGKSGWVGMGNTTGSSFIDEDVRVGGTYTYTVRCINSSGAFISGYNAEGWRYTYQPSQLKTPTITKFESTAEGVRLTWDAVDDANGYRVFYKGRNGWVGMGNTNATAFLDKDVRDGGTYTYTVRCIDSKGNFSSDYRRDGWTYTYSKPQLATPQGVTFESTLDGVKIKWKRVEGSYGYRVFYKGRSGWVGMDNVYSNSYVDTDVRDGGSYTYTVRCINSKGEFISGYNADGWKYTYQKPWLTTPVFSVENTARGVRLDWNAVDGAESYRIFRKNNDGTWQGLGNTTGTRFFDTKVSAGTAYTYTVRCITKDGKSFTSLYDTTGKTIRWKNISTDFVDKLLADKNVWETTHEKEIIAFDFVDLDDDGNCEMIAHHMNMDMENTSRFEDIFLTQKIWYYDNGVVRQAQCDDFLTKGLLLKKHDNQTNANTFGAVLYDTDNETFISSTQALLRFQDGRIELEPIATAVMSQPGGTGAEVVTRFYREHGSYADWKQHKFNRTAITEEQYNAALAAAGLQGAEIFSGNSAEIDFMKWNTLSASAKRQKMLECYNAYTY